MTLEIKTASWFTLLPDDHVRIGISRGTPRGQAAGYRRYPALAPGAWFNSVTPAAYLLRYGEILDALNPGQVAADLARIAEGRTPVIVCFESAAKIGAGETFCHRHLAARWLADRADVAWQEVGAPDDFDAFALFRKAAV